jgi:hypothetical protein
MPRGLGLNRAAEESKVNRTLRPLCILPSAL